MVVSKPHDSSEVPLIKALVVVAHPDDAEYGCSGSIAKFTRQGLDAVYVICTDGGSGTEDRSMPSAELSALRKREQRDAGRILGLKDVIFLDFPDGGLQADLKLRKAITRQIRIQRPEIVITTNSNRQLTSANYLGHPDHFAAGEAALSAVFPAARDHLSFPELLRDEGLEPWKVREVWVMMGPNPQDMASFFNPLEERDVDRSIKALLAHVSQIAEPERTKGWMRERRSELAKHTDAAYAESFKRFFLS